MRSFTWFDLIKLVKNVFALKNPWTAWTWHLCFMEFFFFFSSRWGVPCCTREKDLRQSVVVYKVWSLCHTNFSTGKVCLLFIYCCYKLIKHGWKLWVTVFSWNAQLLWWDLFAKITTETEMCFLTCRVSHSMNTLFWALLKGCMAGLNGS